MIPPLPDPPEKTRYLFTAVPTVIVIPVYYCYGVASRSDDVFAVWIYPAKLCYGNAFGTSVRKYKRLEPSEVKVFPPYRVRARHIKFLSSKFAQVIIYVNPSHIQCNTDRTNYAIRNLFMTGIRVRPYPHVITTSPELAPTFMKQAVLKFWESDLPDKQVAFPPVPPVSLHARFPSWQRRACITS